MKCTSFCVLAVCAFVSAGTVNAQSDGGQASPSHARPRPAMHPAMYAAVAAAHARRTSPRQREERRFLKDAAASSRFEAEASRMALARSSDPGLRSFAAMLINHHASASNELLNLLYRRGMAAPMLANDQRKTLNRLARLQGAKFNRVYLEEVALKYQQEDVQYYEKASLVAREPRLKAWIDRTLPTLRYHTAAAERLVPPDLKLARGAGGAPPSVTENAFASRASVDTRSMGFGSAPSGGTPLGGLQFGDAAQLGIAQPARPRPIAVRPSESSTR